MKNIILSSIAFVFLFTACDQKNKEVVSANSEIETPAVETPSVAVDDIKPEIEIKKATSSSFSINGIVNEYLSLKNALVNDDSKAAALAAEKLVITLSDLNSSSLDSKGKNNFDGIAAEMIKDLKHISGNAGKMDHQREYFALVSKEVTDLVKTFGTDRKLYKDYCPMYDGGKSGYWISETKEIKNPYYGSEMLSCGGIVETLK
jgi:hypothetical protein